MAEPSVRVGIVGAGANTKLRHIPGLREQRNVEIVAVCNRRPESTSAVAEEYGIPSRHERWEDLVADPGVDAVVIGTWPYLHAPITIAALQAGKHVLCEARMARNLAEAREMLAASRARPDLVAQIVPSPIGFKGDRVVKRLLAEGFVGPIREIHVDGLTAAFADPKAPLHWRQNAEFSGQNMLTLGIVHETAMRWVAPVERLVAQTNHFVSTRVDPDSGGDVEVGTPDSVQVLTIHAGGARGVYRLSGVAHALHGHGITLCGADGTLEYRMADDSLWGASAGEERLREIAIPENEAYDWRVEAEFVAAIRGRESIEFTDFPTGVGYMAFTDAVARSATTGSFVSVEIP